MTNAVATLLRTTRPAFLLLTLVCVLLGIASALLSQPSISPGLTLLVLVCALAAHMSVNVLNEYADFVTGVDLHTQPTPFSGGSGALPAAPQRQTAVLVLGLALLLVTLLSGGYLVLLRGWQLMPLGVLGVLLILLYTPWLNRQPWLCLIAPGLGFGLLMVVGTHWALTGERDYWPALLGLVPFCLTNNLLLLNQYPDIAADAASGRRHVPIVYGVAVSNWLYGVFLLTAAWVIVGMAWSQQLHPLAGLALIPLIAGVYAWLGARHHGRELGKHPGYLAANVICALATPLVLALTMVIVGR